MCGGVAGQMNLAPGPLKGHAVSTRDGDMQSHTHAEMMLIKLLERISGQDTVFHWIEEHAERDTIKEMVKTDL